jgi:hypothetical protein
MKNVDSSTPLSGGLEKLFEAVINDALIIKLFTEEEKNSRNNFSCFSSDQE